MKKEKKRAEERKKKNIFKGHSEIQPVKKRKKLLDKKKKLKVTYDKIRDVYIVKMKGKKYLLKRKEPVRKLRTRKAKDALKEHKKFE